jgi:hypothetical protein
MVAQIRCNTVAILCVPEVHREPRRIRTSLTNSPNKPALCKHNRLISDRVTEEEHNGGKVRCVECGDVIADPHL